jgi:hypothetical protein
LKVEGKWYQPGCSPGEYKEEEAISQL